MAWRWLNLTAVGLCSLVPLAVAHAGPSNQPVGEIANFNEALRHATRTMNVAALLALWDEEGITLLPDTPPVVGKPAIARYLKEVTAQLGAARVQRFDMTCFNITVSGGWASEWCQEHQIVDLGSDKPPFEGRGNMLLVLRRRADGQWRLNREMWNQAAPLP